MLEEYLKSFTQFIFLILCSKLYNNFPSIMKYVPGAHHTIFKTWKLLKKFMQEQINKHKEDWNPSESRDYIDSYLLEISKVSNGEKTLLEWGSEIRRDGNSPSELSVWPFMSSGHTAGLSP